MPELLLIPPTGECLDLNEAKLHLRVTEPSQDAIIASHLTAARVAAEKECRRQLLHARWRLYQDNFPMAGSGTPLPLAEQVNIPGYAMILPHGPTLSVQQIQYLDMNGTVQVVDPSIYYVNPVSEPAVASLAFGQIWPIPLPQVNAVWVDYTAGYSSPFQASGNQLSVNGAMKFSVGQVVQLYNSGGALPSGLNSRTPYLVAAAEVASVPVADPNPLTPAATIPYYSGAYTLTDMAGDPVTLTDQGSGTSYIGLFIGGNNEGVVPDGIRSWMKIRLGSLYENREEVAILSRGQIKELPFIDGLLDPYRMSLP